MSRASASVVTATTTSRAKENNTDARGWANVLAGVPLFADLNRRHLNKVAALGRIRRFHDKTTIVRAGDRGDALYVILDGEVSIRRPGLAELSLGMGSFFGEMALLDSAARSATVVAKGPVLCLTIGQPRFVKLLHAEPAIAVALLKEVAARLRKVQAISS
jgi:CRP-like cAMP-binding protein